MANQTASDSNGRNVEPLSSTLHIQTMDVDASGLTHGPIDGEFLSTKGFGAACGQSSGTPSPMSDALTPLALADAGAATLCMVWSEEGRSDVQATGRKRVPVMWHGSMHCKLSLYNYDDANLPISGDLVYVSGNHSTVDTAVQHRRLIASCASAANSNAKNGWCVGVVVRDVATAGDPLEVLLYEHPVLTEAAV